MPFQILLNIIIAVMWMFLSETYNFTSFLVGYIIGILMLFVLQRFIPDTFYIKRVFSVIKLIMLFVRELLLSNIDIVKLAYKPKLDIQPGIFALPIDLKSNWEITLLANLISLTPGTLSLEVSEDYSKIYIHAMDIPDVEQSIKDIKETFEKAIMEVTR
ncbi:Na(+)/H(+) antiporter subunit E [Halobacillus andaensis]|uniref:Na(+)/H(+) antiporter subunit E n=1 Tax=Halobacillus andaensis TaxID=1176239 RepID=A0A917ET81_HALAA|nr:Na+/H+ antiporter subunit E [Halobacillus andaensis]MBP2003013.1 multicomponent Na+:H+ antiporter subunit E [Halobacillus andaensis]GGF07371.1 Na(+)/H(+) antiporter subunit E [Halobacillus andaensis]